MAGAGRLDSELAKSTEHPFEEREIRPVIQVVRLVDADESLVSHVTDENTGDAERNLQRRSDLGDRTDILAQPGDCLPFWAEHDCSLLA
jgi:hypothetical protein